MRGVWQQLGVFVALLANAACKQGSAPKVTKPLETAQQPGVEVTFEAGGKTFKGAREFKSTIDPDEVRKINAVGTTMWLMVPPSAGARKGEVAHPFGDEFMVAVPEAKCGKDLPTVGTVTVNGEPYTVGSCEVKVEQ
jgi:hypothetical protein